jgi:hypothetical protein
MQSDAVRKVAKQTTTKRSPTLRIIAPREPKAANERKKAYGDDDG